MLKRTASGGNVFCWPGDNGGAGRLYTGFSTGTTTLSNPIANSTCYITSVAGTDSVQVRGLTGGIIRSQYSGTYRVEVCGNRQHHVSQSNKFYDALGSGTVRNVVPPNDSTIYSAGNMFFLLV